MELMIPLSLDRVALYVDLVALATITAIEMNIFNSTSAKNIRSLIEF